jgi:hypothetical protein
MLQSVDQDASQCLCTYQHTNITLHCPDTCSTTMLAELT